MRIIIKLQPQFFSLSAKESLSKKSFIHMKSYHADDLVVFSVDISLKISQIHVFVFMFANYVCVQYQFNTRKATLVAPPPHLQVSQIFFLPFHLVNIRCQTQKFLLIIHSVSVHITPTSSCCGRYIIHYSQCCHYPEILYCVQGNIKAHQ